MRNTGKYRSPLGGMTMASDGENLCGLWFDGQKYFAAGLEKGYEEKNLSIFDETRAWLDEYFSGRLPDFMPKLSLRGSAFQQTVWAALLRIPFGKTRTYGEIAREVAAQSGGKRMSAQAVGGAVGRNPVSVLVPCHRVVGTGGSLTGYAGGLDKKLFLLRLEGADTGGLFVPKGSTALQR